MCASLRAISSEEIPQENHLKTNAIVLSEIPIEEQQHATKAERMAKEKQEKDLPANRSKYR